MADLLPPAAGGILALAIDAGTVVVAGVPGVTRRACSTLSDCRWGKADSNRATLSIRGAKWALS